MFEVNRHPSPRELRTFGRAMLIGFGVIGVVIWLLAWRKGLMPGLVSWTGAGAQLVAVALWLLGAGLFGLMSLAPEPARPVYVAWMTVANAMGIVMSTALLTVLFVVLLPWFSLVVRFGDPLRKRLKSEGSYWEDYKPRQPTIDRLRRPF